MGDDRTRLLEEMYGRSPDALIVVGPDGVIALAGPATEAIFGYRPEEIEGQSVEILLPENVRALHRVYRATYASAPEGRAMGVGRELYGRHKDGTIFAVDVSLAPTVLDGKAWFGAFVRDATERKRGEDVLRFVNEISRTVISGERTPELLQRTARAARALVGAAAAWISIRSGEDMLVAAADGQAAELLEGATAPMDKSLAARAMMRQEMITVPDMAAEPEVMAEARVAGFGAGLYVPMSAEEGAVGSLVLARGKGQGDFDQSERAAARVFASAAALVLTLGAARRSLEHMRLTAEHERIARDLHDTVIQRLFGLGMRLQAAERLADGPVAERIRSTVDAIDEVIREIRETIFDLNRPEGIETSSLRIRFRELVADSAETLGFRPRTAFRGPVDAAVPDELVSTLIAVLRESLSNVNRHAQATGVDVVLAVADGWVTLTVGDDGIGMETQPAAGHGLANLEARALELGGEFSTSPRLPSGTLLQWRVPVKGSQEGRS